MKKIAILLTVYNRREKTVKCLESVFAQSSIQGYEVDVYMTDDGCTDGTSAAVMEMFPDVRIIKGDGTLFWNRGMWTAWDFAANEKDYDYYLWLNDDTFLFEGAIFRLLESSRTKSDEAIIIGATVDTITKRVQTYGGRINEFLAPCEGYDLECEHFNGNIVLIPRSVFRILGNLDYNLVHSLGDFDYGWRAQKAGIKMYQCGTYLGACDTHQQIAKWCDPNVSIIERWKALHRPNGMPPSIIFYITKKHKGVVSALSSSIKVYIRCLLPWLWKK